VTWDALLDEVRRAVDERGAANVKVAVARMAIPADVAVDLARLGVRWSFEPDAPPDRVYVLDTRMPWPARVDVAP
jgi:hypothetical protein